MICDPNYKKNHMDTTSVVRSVINRSHSCLELLCKYGTHTTVIAVKNLSPMAFAILMHDLTNYKHFVQV